MSGGKKKDGTGSREVVPGWSMLRCSADRDIRLTGDAFSARKSILRGGSRVMTHFPGKTSVGVKGISLPCVFWLSQWARVPERGIGPPTALLWTRGGTGFL